MQINRFLRHHGLADNPFVAEEARHDPVFTKLGLGPTTHPDFDKIVGDLGRAATSIVFGEKGAGKTAIRLQLAARVAEHNLANPQAKVLLIAYDDLNPVVDRLCQAAGLPPHATDRPKDVVRALKKARLSDHMDAILHLGVADLVDRLLGDEPSADGSDLGVAGLHALKRSPDHVKRDLVLLQVLYDRPDPAGDRTHRLIKLLRPRAVAGRGVWGLLFGLGWLLPLLVLAGTVAYAATLDPVDPGAAPPSGFLEHIPHGVNQIASGALSDDAQGVAGVLFIAAMAAWGLGLAKVLIWDGLMRSRWSAGVRRGLRVTPRSKAGVAASLRAAPGLAADRALWPTDGAEDVRYELLAKLRGVAGRLGYAGVVVVLDRVDEPTLINGDQERMRCLVWPLLNNKFLQQDGFGVKMLLPLELRFELFRESAAFFQEARLDKQNLIERLSWSGAMLYDLCNARLNACRQAGAEAISLLDLFDEAVTRQDLVDALDQMHQPRDAFKLIYQCMQEHCANVTEEDGAWRIPRPVLDNARRAQADRGQMFQRGARPA